MCKELKFKNYLFGELEKTTATRTIFEKSNHPFFQKYNHQFMI